MRIRSCCFLLLLVISFQFIFSISSDAFINGVFAAEEKESKSGGSSLIPDWIEDVINSVGRLSSKVSELVTYTGKVFKGGLSFLLEQTIGRMFESFYKWVSGALSNWLLSTPKLIDQPLLYDGWRLVTIFACVIIALGAGISFMKVLGGSKSYRDVLYVMLVSFLLCPFTLYLVDFTMQFQNVLWDRATHETLQDIYKTAGGSSGSSVKHLGKPIVGTGQRYNVTSENISIRNVDGDALMKLCFVGPEYYDRVLQLNGGKKTMFYEFFVMKESDLDSNTDMSSVSTYGGLIGMSWVMINLIILSLFAFVRFGAIYVIGWLINFFISYAVIKGSMEPIAGLINMIGRIIALQSIVDLGWLVMVKVNSPKVELGVGALVINCFIISVLNVLVWFFFIQWIRKCIAAPLSLAGAAAIESFSKTGAAFGSGISQVGERFGLQGMQDFGSNMTKRGNEVQEKAARIKDNARSILDDNETMDREGLLKSWGNVFHNDTKKDRTNTEEYGHQSSIYKKEKQVEELLDTHWSELDISSKMVKDVEGMGRMLVETVNERELVNYLSRNGYKKDLVRLNSDDRIEIASKHRDEIVSKIMERYSGAKVNELKNYTENKKTSFTDFKLKCTADEKQKVMQHIENSITKKNICKMTETGMLRVASEDSGMVEKAIRDYQSSKVKYIHDAVKNNYLVYDEKLNDFATYSKAPDNGICIETR